MKFMPFDFEHHLKTYNQTKKLSKRRSDFNFLQALNDDSLVAFNLANELLQKSAQIGPQQSVGHRGSFLDGVNVQIENNDFTGIRESLKQLAQFIASDSMQSWYLEQHHRLSSADFWQQISSQPITKSSRTQLARLKEQWLSKQSYFSAHSTASLSFGAHHILSFFEDYYYFARVEFSVFQYKIPKKLRVAYQEYLSNAKKMLAEAKQQFCQNMLLRLQLAVAVGDITYCDHIHFTKQFLNKHNLIKQRNNNSSYRRADFGAEHFQQFLRYIVKFGTQTQKIALTKLSLFTNDEHYIAWQNSETLIIAPKIFYDRELIPHSAPWFPTLFKQRQFRYQFFEKNAWLISSVRLLENYPLENQDLSVSVEHIKEIEEKLVKSDQELQANTATRFFGLFGYKLTLLKVEWNHYLRNARISLLKKKMALVISIHKRLCEHNATFLDFKPTKQLIDEIETGLSQFHLSTQECETFYVIKVALLAKQSSVQNRLSSSGLSSCSSTNPFDTSVSSNPFDKSPALTQTKTMTLTSAPIQPRKTDPILLELLQNLKLMSLDIDNFHEAIISIKNAIIAVSQQSGTQEKKLLRKVLENIFIQYLKHIISMNSVSEVHKSKEKLDAIEQILLSHADEHIRTRIQANCDCRQEANYFFVFRLKCRSYLASYQPKISPLLITNSAIINALPSPKAEDVPAPQLVQAQ